MFEGVIVDQNPHWEGVLYQERVPRGMLGKVKSYLDLPHVIALFSVRRCGKSTLVRQTIIRGWELHQLLTTTNKQSPQLFMRLDRLNSEG